MKSIKEAAEDFAYDPYFDIINEDSLEGFEVGAYYVLDAVEEATNICFDEELKRVIKQLKGNQ